MSKRSSFTLLFYATLREGEVFLRLEMEKRCQVPPFHFEFKSAAGLLANKSVRQYGKHHFIFAFAMGTNHGGTSYSQITVHLQCQRYRQSDRMTLVLKCQRRM